MNSAQSTRRPRLGDSAILRTPDLCSRRLRSATPPGNGNRDRNGYYYPKSNAYCNSNGDSDRNTNRVSYTDPYADANGHT